MTDDAIIAEALAKTSDTERTAYLDAVCEGTEQRARVEAHLGNVTQNADVTRSVVADADNTRSGPPADDHAGETLDATSFLARSERPGALGRLAHYDVQQVLGQGGFGIVYRAFDDKLQRTVAVKVLAPHLASSPAARKRFLREARSAAAVKHENVVQVYAVEEQPLPFLVMEYLPGETLQQRIDRTGPLELPELLRVGRQIAGGLAAAHAQDLIHRDIKPSNILLDAGSPPAAKITDFGLARAADDASLTRSGTVAGTPMFMAPEQARGETLDQRADLFSLGSVLYALASGRPPFPASNTLAVLKRVVEDAPRPIRDFAPEVPGWFCRIVDKLHAKEPDDRFQTAHEVADLLADCERQLAENDRLTDTSRIPVAARPPVKKKAVPAWVWVLVAVLGLFVIGCVGLPVLGAMFLWLRPGDNPQLDEPKSVMNGPSATNQPPAVLKQDERFIPLFNGTDSTGWQEYPSGRGSWAVVDGVLVGKGKPSHLFTNRGDFGDFHLRVELRVRDGKNAGAMGVLGRVPLEDPGTVLSPHGDASLYRQPVPKLYDDTVPPPKPAPPSYREQPLVVAAADLKGESTVIKKCIPGEWMTYELIMDGEHITVRLAQAGQNASSFAYAKAKSPSGHIALQLFDDWSAVEIRKIEVKDLPAVKPADPRLKGDWVVVSSGRDEMGKPTADDEETFLHLGDGKFEMLVAGRRSRGSYTVDTGSKELLLLAEGAPERLPLRYEFDGDRLRLRVHTGSTPGDSLAQLNRRVESLNNLKELALAAHNYEQAFTTLPPAGLPSSKGDNTTPLLSWRVALLPFMEHDALYRQFKHDEPWDSEHNKKLIPKMPRVFATPGANAPPGQTNYRAFTGPGTPFEVKKGGIRLSAFEDGSSNTLLFVESAESVIWTKPDDLPYDPKKPLPKLGATPHGVNVAWADGSVENLPAVLPEADLRRMITRNDGYVVNKPEPGKRLPPLRMECVRSAFRPLLNGTDLAGWTPLDREPTDWKVEGGELVGRNRTETTLAADKEHTDFHLRAEVKLAGTGEAGLSFVGGSDAKSPGAGVDLTARRGVRFGSVVSGGKVVAESDLGTAPADWFRLEVIATGRLWRVLIDGRPVAEYRQPIARERTGLMIHQSRTPQPGDDLVVRIRKLEIRELPAPPN